MIDFFSSLALFMFIGVYISFSLIVVQTSTKLEPYKQLENMLPRWEMWLLNARMFLFWPIIFLEQYLNKKQGD